MTDEENRQTPPPSSHVAGSLWDQLVVLSGYHITRPPTPDHEFVQVCNGDLRKMVELMGAGSSHSSQTAGRWRAFEDTTPGYWGIELEDAGNDDDAIVYPQKIHRDTVARIVEAHNAALSPPPQAHVAGPQPCGIADPSTRDCPNMKEVGGGMDGERYRCAVCGKGYFLDYEEMK